MSNNEKKSSIERWINSPAGKQLLGAGYSLGASVVIIGAMFKILHLAGAGTMLGIGMSVEAFLFALGVFDQPHPDYPWDKVYDFENGGMIYGTTSGNIGTAEDGASLKNAVNVQSRQSVGLNYTQTIDDKDVQNLSDGIKNLSATAEQLAGLSEVLASTKQFTKSLDDATNLTNQFTKSQDGLNHSAQLLTGSYQSISDGMETVDKNTKSYAAKVEDINRNLSAINSLYEVHLKNIQNQTEGLNQQTDKVRLVTNVYESINIDVQKMKDSTRIAADESEHVKSEAARLTKQISDLNDVYGNMLNSLS
jgi:gliding motility-associated protein GldL